jgi:hypothetical protein
MKRLPKDLRRKILRHNARALANSKNDSQFDVLSRWLAIYLQQEEEMR